MNNLRWTERYNCNWTVQKKNGEICISVCERTIEDWIKKGEVLRDGLVKPPYSEGCWTSIGNLLVFKKAIRAKMWIKTLWTIGLVLGYILGGLFLAVIYIFVAACFAAPRIFDTMQDTTKDLFGEMRDIERNAYLSG